MEEGTMPRTLVIGGGVAGPVTAMALQLAGFEPVVYEAHTLGEDAGSYLTVATNGIDALRAVGADGPVLAAGFPTPVNVLLSTTGRELGRVSNGGTLADGTTSHTIRRPDLHAALRDEAARRGVGFEYGKRLVGAEAGGPGVVASFADGSTASGALLVGADGIHSPTRRLIDQAAPSPRYVGLVNFGGYTPGMAPDEPGAWRMIFGKRAFFGSVSDPHGGTIWFANVPRQATTPAERETTSEADWLAQLAELFAADRGPAADLIAAGGLQLAGDNTHDLPRVPRWSNGPMVLVGDAAHAPSPTSGQGASLAAEDAVVLARCLRDLPDVPSALAAYEAARRRRVERIVAQAARTGSAKTPGPAGRALRDLLLPLVFRFLVTERSMAWVYDHHLDWEAKATTGARSGRE
jgi:FAD-dependent urate hydroxylase